MKKLHIGIAVIISCIVMTVSCFAEYDSSVVQQVQEALNNAGFDCGTPDGIAGSGTAAAVSDFQEANGLTVDGQISDELLISLGLKEVETAVEAEAIEKETNLVNDVQTDGELKCYEGTSFPIIEEVLPSETVGFAWPEAKIDDYPDYFQVTYRYVFGADNAEGVDLDKTDEVQEAFEKYMSEKYKVKYADASVTKLSDSKDGMDYYRTVFVDGDKGIFCISSREFDSNFVETGGVVIQVVVINSLSSLF